ncbi:MAG: DUF4097 family beta strand repeat-containing protein [Acidobacteriota bacterium]
MRKQGSIFWSLTLISIGVLFLLGNLSPSINPWVVIAKFWPLLIVFWGISKLVTYLTVSDPFAVQRTRLSGGDIVLLLLILVVGSGFSKMMPAGWWTHPARSWTIDIDEGTSGEAFSDFENAFTSTEELSQELAARENRIEIVNRYGDVEVTVHDLAQIRVVLQKKVGLSDPKEARELAETVKLRIEKVNSGYRVSTNREELQKAQRNRLRTNLQIWVPRATEVNLTNKYGAVSVERLAGQQRVSNEYGSLSVREIAGPVDISNRYGSIEAVQITGNCRVENMYGSIRLDEVGGAVDLENGYGSVALARIKGTAKLQHRYGELSCQNLESSLSVEGRHVEVKASKVAGDVKVLTSYKDVELQNVGGEIRVDGKHGDIRIADEHSPTRPIQIDAAYSAVTISLPRDSRFKLEVFSKYGTFSSDFDSEGDRRFSDDPSGSRLVTSHGSDGPLIRVNTSFREVRLQAS